MAKRKNGGGSNGQAVATIDADELVQRVKDDPESELEDHEVKWLQDHDLLPDVWEKVPVTFDHGGQEVSNDPNFFAAQRLQDEDRFNEEVERRAQLLAAEMVKAEQHENLAGVEYHGNAVNTPAQGGRNPGFEPDNSSVEEEGESSDDYSDWQGDELRAELARRELPVGGKVADLRQRLVDDDNGLDTSEPDEE